MKYLKYLKYIVVTFLLINVLVIIGVIIKYNIDLNKYINQEEDKASVINNDSTINGTQVYILGSVHFETEKIKRDDFYHFINSISPSVILKEGDKKTIASMLNRTDFFNQVMNTFKKGNEVETFVALKYIKHHPECEVLPYEWEERDAFHLKHDLNNKSSELLNSVSRLESEDLLSDEQSSLVHEFYELNKAYYQISRNAHDLHDINNEATDSIIRDRQLYVYKKIPEIAKERKELEEYKDFIPIHMGYWDTRNKAMVENILSQIKLNPNKRIVVLNGYSHRYYLIDKLKKYQEKFNFSIK